MSYEDGKMCVNCQYWDGERKINPFHKDRAQAWANAQGICQNKKAGINCGRMHLADWSYCNLFTKWDQLK